ncbi:hypothetical protein L228DRAFT_266008 [Xylona heveae TC161]|uniref:DRBM domain-containing protein n=1 Tax=Xylona heveae (strain CBS 132557 / TC161) TaxID=1328760 RepID=A0A165IYA1_XYLHT|nr:hypothetical protein L228DRAFT_266008 [Xylona heveae TC161]KZF25542.1 hypothetical protein L228DRAFT_266008 [Xylona heveae TC161]
MSSPICPSSPAANGGRQSSWQERLQGVSEPLESAPPTRATIMTPPPDPTYRGAQCGRTAWSSTVTVSPSNAHNAMTISARYWYDGQYVNNAKEDAAEVALQTLQGAQGIRSPAAAAVSYQGQMRGW